MTGKLALFLRVFILLPAAGLLAVLPFIDLDRAAGVLAIDINAASMALAALIYGAGAGGTFAWSRWAKALGGET
ncbi:hypothetical protein [Salipiger abyssi]|uniref:hypothetical protein n=1 Tax=Salipiger abyssi TaxID=1250539 RepID=UPI004059C228